MKKLYTAIVFIFLSSTAVLFAQSFSEKELINKVDSSLAVLVNLQTKVKDVYPCLEEFQPVAVVYKDSLIIFDYDSAAQSYKLVKETIQPFPLPEGIQASFPLSVYNNYPTCIVNPKTFSTTAGYATIMHEFIHCCEYKSVETELKQTLEIYRDAMQNKDYSWEIAHPFPYNDSIFVNLYDNYKRALEKNEIKKAKEYRFRIIRHLSGVDFDYMLWQEWKEGLARYVENKVLKRLGLMPNTYGKDEPYDRVAFYYSGELLISRLAELNPKLPSDMKLLFEKMKEF